VIPLSGNLGVLLVAMIIIFLTALKTIVRLQLIGLCLRFVEKYAENEEKTKMHLD